MFYISADENLILHANSSILKTKMKNYASKYN